MEQQGGRYGKSSKSKNDFPDTVYFGDWFAQVPVDELMGKTIYIDPNCISFDGDRTVLKKLKAMGVIAVTKKAFDAKQVDYIVVPTGWTKTRKSGITKEEKLVMTEWKKRGAPLRLYWKHIFKEIGC